MSEEIFVGQTISYLWIHSVEHYWTQTNVIYHGITKMYGNCPQTMAGKTLFRRELPKFFLVWNLFGLTSLAQHVCIFKFLNWVIYLLTDNESSHGPVVDACLKWCSVTFVSSSAWTETMWDVERTRRSVELRTSRATSETRQEETDCRDWEPNQLSEKCSAVKVENGPLFIFIRVPLLTVTFLWFFVYSSLKLSCCTWCYCRGLSCIWSHPALKVSFILKKTFLSCFSSGPVYEKWQNQTFLFNVVVCVFRLRGRTVWRRCSWWS